MPIGRALSALGVPTTAALVPQIEAVVRAERIS